MLPYTIAQALGQARLDDWHRQARRDALARAGRQALRASRQQTPRSAPVLVAALTRWARGPRGAVRPAASPAPPGAVTPQRRYGLAE